MFDYKQRPWSRPISDDEYNRAVGNVPSIDYPGIEHVCNLAGFTVRFDVCPRCEWNTQAGRICRWCECIVDSNHRDAAGNTTCPAWTNGTHEARDAR